MPLDNVAKNLGLEAIAAVAVSVSLHEMDPDTPNTATETAAGRETPTWDTAIGGDLVLSAPLAFTGGDPGGPVTWFAVWKLDGTTRLAKGQIVAGDLTFDGSGEYTLTTGTRLRIED